MNPAELQKKKLMDLGEKKKFGASVEDVDNYTFERRAKYPLFPSGQKHYLDTLKQDTQIKKKRMMKNIVELIL